MYKLRRTIEAAADQEASVADLPMEEPVSRSPAPVHSAPQVERANEPVVLTPRWPQEAAPAAAPEVSLVIPARDVQPGEQRQASELDNVAVKIAPIEAPVASFWEEVEKAGGVTHAAPEKVAVEAAKVEQAIRPGVALGRSYTLLGQYFVNQGMITPDQLKQALREQDFSYAPIGTILVANGWVSGVDVERALEKQKETRSLQCILHMQGLKVNHIRSSLMRIEERGEPIQQVMRDTGYLSEEHVALAVAALKGYQYFPAERMHACRFAEMQERGMELSRYSGFIPVATFGDHTIVVAVEDPDNINDAHNLYSGTWKNVRYVIASARTLHKIYCSYFSKTEKQLLDMIRNAEHVIRNRLEQKDGNENFVRKLIGMMLKHGCYSGASDLRLIQSRHIATLSMRYDGVLKDVAYYDKELHQRITTLLHTDGVEGNVGSEGAHGLMREGSITFERDKAARQEFADIFERYGFRLQMGKMVKDANSAVTRIIDNQGVTADLDNLNFDARTREVIDQSIHSPDGLILLVGPTGSGKTTTLYACMEEIDAEENSIQTIEHPVEGIHGKWMQYQVVAQAGISEGKAMSLIFKGLMRNDPDVILVGEIRDDEVADTAIQASKTGHLVFSTLHVTRASAVLTRLTGLGVSLQDIADTLRLVIAQRLVRKVCAACAIPDTRESTAKRFEKPMSSFLADVTKPKFLKACDGGCEECLHTGFRGRTMIYETMHVNGKLRRMIEAGATTSDIEREAIPAGHSMYEVGMRLVANGVTSFDELVRCVSESSEEL